MRTWKGIDMTDDRIVDLIKSGQKFRFRHFKGTVYQVDMLTLDSEDPNKLRVIYHCDEHPYTYWDRPLDDFLSEVDHDKYPEVTQKYRFELLED